MTDDKAVLVDTNVLLSATAPLRPLHRAALPGSLPDRLYDTLAPSSRSMKFRFRLWLKRTEAR
jgi:hypothetical protein